MRDRSFDNPPRLALRSIFDEGGCRRRSWTGRERPTPPETFEWFFHNTKTWRGVAAIGRTLGDVLRRHPGPTRAPASTLACAHRRAVRRIEVACTNGIGRQQAMKQERDSRLATAHAATVILLVLGTVACSSSAPSLQPGTQAPGPSASSLPTASPTSIWSELLRKTPYPFRTPLPPVVPTILDGTYVKLDPKEATHVPCRRCPDYAPEGGIWKLSFDKGVFRIFHEATGWRSLGSFFVSGNQLQLFNDPYCHEVIGTYTWTLGEGRLALEAIEDECAIRLRAKNLTSQPWLSCRPPSPEAATSGHWLEPPGC